jgi:hypothetical protein
MKNRNAILFSRIDREDAWVCGGLVFKVQNTRAYEDSYNEVKSKLETDEVVNHVIEDRCLLSNLFVGDESFKFIKTYWNRGLYFVFENNDGEELEYRMSANYVRVF